MMGLNEVGPASSNLRAASLYFTTISWKPRHAPFTPSLESGVTCRSETREVLVDQIDETRTKLFNETMHLSATKSRKADDDPNRTPVSSDLESPKANAGMFGDSRKDWTVSPGGDDVTRKKIVRGKTDSIVTRL